MVGKGWSVGLSSCALSLTRMGQELQEGEEGGGEGRKMRRVEESEERRGASGKPKICFTQGLDRRDLSNMVEVAASGWLWRSCGGIEVAVVGGVAPVSRRRWGRGGGGVRIESARSGIDIQGMEPCRNGGVVLVSRPCRGGGVGGIEVLRGWLPCRGVDVVAMVVLRVVLVWWSYRGGGVDGVEGAGAAGSDQARRRRVVHWWHGAGAVPQDGGSGIARVHTDERRVEVGGAGGGWFMFEFEKAEWRAPQIKLPPRSRPDPEHNFHLSQFVVHSV
ncbi:hypothetical protein EDB85DRAFT_1899435 [Lactarius pseudohatsudake]|nr:hypothetical protein EDB85DRAFT_1899435 [Lactarius pseudohatsudake]